MFFYLFWLILNPLHGISFSNDDELGISLDEFLESPERVLSIADTLKNLLNDGWVGGVVNNNGQNKFD